jgi:hypothetical protein
LSIKVAANGSIELRNPINQQSVIGITVITINVNDKIGLALDTEAGTMSVYVNGVFNQTTNYGANFLLSGYDFTGQNIYAQAVVNFEGNVTIVATPDFIPPGFDLLDMNLVTQSPALLFTRTFNSPAEPYEVSQNATFNADHILLSNQINEEWSRFWGLAEWADEPMPVTFTGMHRVEVDFYDYVGPNATFTINIGGPVNFNLETEISTVSGTLVVAALLFESGEGGIYVQLKDENSSIKISEIRIYEAQ